MSEYYEFRANKKSDIVDGKSFPNAKKALDREKTLKTLKNQINASMDLALRDKSCCSDDTFLSRFLYIQKFECDDAFRYLIKYLNFKANNSEWLNKMNIFDDKIQMALRDGNPRVLPQRDRKGRKIITFAASNWDPNKYELIDVYRAFLISIDKLLENVHNQALGFVVIVDWTDLNFSQSRHLKPKILKLMITSLQECIPANFKGIHFVSQPWYVDLVSTLIKSLLSDKMRRRLFFHGTNLATLHNYVNKDVLPPDLAGEGPNTTTLDWYHYLLEESQTTQQYPKSYRLIQNTIYSKIPQTS